MTSAPRLGRRASIVFSLFCSYAVFTGLVTQIFGGLPAVFVPLPVGATAAVFLVFGASLLAGARVYTFRPGRFATFARLSLGLPLLAAGLIFFLAAADYDTFPIFFALRFPIFAIIGWVFLVGIPAWLIAVARSAR